MKSKQYQEDQNIGFHHCLSGVKISAIKALCCFTLACLLLTARESLGQEVRYSFDASADFSRFKTYKYITMEGTDEVDSLLDTQIKRALDTELTNKGLARINDNNADLYVRYEIAIREEKQVGFYDDNWQFGPGWHLGTYGRPPGLGTTLDKSLIIHTGQLDVDIYDTAHHDLIWRGVVSKTVDPKAKPDKQRKNLIKSVAKLLKYYPPEE